MCIMAQDFIKPCHYLWNLFNVPRCVHRDLELLQTCLCSTQSYYLIKNEEANLNTRFDSQIDSDYQYNTTDPSMY